MVVCANVIGVWVEPGPVSPPTSPAMMRTNAPPSSDDNSLTSPPSIAWYLGVANLSFFGRFTHNWMPWKVPPLSTSSAGGVSMCRIPDPAVIHWVAPSVIRPPPPCESWWAKRPSIM